MDLSDRKGWKAAARESLATASYDPKKLILIHTGAVALLSVITTLGGYILSQQLNSATGIGGLGTKSVLQTVEILLQFLPMLVLPFWQIGYVGTTVQIARRKPVSHESLWSGFVHFLPVLRLYLLQMLLYGLIFTVCMYAGSQLFLMTPWAKPLMEPMFALLEDPTNVELEKALMEAAEQAALPMMVINVGLFFAVATPLFYRFRMAQPYIMERPDLGAREAMRGSTRLMRGNKLAIFKLDLSFWWFYLLDAVVSVLYYGDEILAALGVQLPWSEDVSFFLFFVLHLGAMMALYWWRRNEVDVTYAQVYAALQKPKEETEKVNHLWNQV